MLKKCFFFVFIAFDTIVLSAAVHAQVKSTAVRIEWEAPRTLLQDADHFLDVLYFQGAVYADSLPQIPLFAYRADNLLPQYTNEIRILDEVYAEVNDAEQHILEGSGFRAREVTFSLGEQFTRRKSQTVINFYPFRLNPDSGKYEKLISFTLESNLRYDPAKQGSQGRTYALNSVLAAGNWYKLCLDKTGIYRLTHNDLAALGVPVANLQKNQISLFGNGGGMLPEANDAFALDDLQENAIYISGPNEGVFGQADYILFYGQSPNQWKYDPVSGYFDHEVHLYSKENCYFIRVGQTGGKRIETQASVSLPATHDVNTFIDYAYHQQDLQSLLGSGREWYGEVFETTLSRDFTFPFEGISTSAHARVKTAMAARSPVISTFTLRAAGMERLITIPAVNLLDYINFFARDVAFDMEFIPNQQTNLTVNLTYNRPVSTARAWLNYVAVNVTRNLKFGDSQMSFRNPRVSGAGHVVHYTMTNANSQVTIWDVTDRFNIKRQEVVLSGSNLTFRLENDNLKEFVAFNGASFLSPRLLGKIVNQNLHAMDAADMIIISPEAFLSEAHRLAEFRAENDGLTVEVIDPQQIYNEFSSGATDISAIRNFMKMFYDRATRPDELPRYLLLFGNGTIDNKDNLGHGGNLIPTFQSQASLSPSASFMTDDYFGLLADSEGFQAVGLLDLGIGRLPVRTVEEAKDVVDKIIRYDKRVPSMHPMNNDLTSSGQISNYADWRNQVVFVADDGDYNTHFNHAEILSRMVSNTHPEYNIEKIYLDAYTITTMAGGSRYPDVNRALNDKVNKGALLINYIGHGGVKGLAHERILTFEDIATWENFYNLPVFMTATCEFSSFDQPDPNELSAGVRILLKPGGGAIALYTTTRLAWSGTNLTLNENFTRIALKREENGAYPRLGDLIRNAKVASDGNVQSWRLKNFVLLGDPSMRMAYPEYRVVTEEMPDTIRALQEVTVRGYIADESGNRLDNYSGVLFPTIYDKSNTFETLANATGSNKATFNMQNAVIYKGKANIIDGGFSFSFMVPKDISYHFDHGKISYYADDGRVDAHGYYSGFIVGGTAESYTIDNQGPDIRLFMNDTTFVSGGTTNENPILLAYLSDHSGINISGRIGHDIVAFFNDQTAQPIVLNSYYEADVNSYQTGRVVYPLYRLEEGRHTIMVRVWDIHNNPSSAEIEFFVVGSSRMVLDNLINYPNPMGHEGTHFVFTHNLPNTELVANIEIFDLRGRKLKTLAAEIQTGAYRSPPIFWDGTTDNGHPIGNGLYIYRLTLSTSEGKISQQTEKMVIMRN